MITAKMLYEALPPGTQGADLERIAIDTVAAFRARGQIIPRGADLKDIHWLKPDGTEMSDQEWGNDFARCLGVYLSGAALTERDRRGRPLRDDNFTLLFNAHHDTIEFRLPALAPDRRWQVLLDTGYQGGLDVNGDWAGGQVYALADRSLALFIEPGLA